MEDAEMPVSFTLPNHGDERFYLSMSVANYLGLYNTLFKRFKSVWKRPLTSTERTYVKELGICDRPTSFIVRASEMDKYIQASTLSVSNGVVKTEKNADESIPSEFRLNGADVPTIYVQCSSSNTPTSNLLNESATKNSLGNKKIMLRPMTVGEPHKTLGEKPIPFLYTQAEGSLTELYYTSNEVCSYLGRNYANSFCALLYPLLWRKYLSAQEAQQLGIILKNGRTATIFRAREVDEIVAGYGLKYQIPITTDGRLKSYVLDESNERYYIASFVAHAVQMPNSFTGYFNKLWKRFITEADKAILRDQGVYCARLTSLLLKASEVDQILDGKGSKFHGAVSRKPAMFPSARSLHLRKAIRRAKLSKLRSGTRPAMSNLSEKITEGKWQVQNEIIHEKNDFEEELMDIAANGLPKQNFDCEKLKSDATQDFFKMCVALRLPLTLIENSAFRSLCKTFMNIGYEFSQNFREKAMDEDVFLPSYAELRSFVDGVLVPRRDVLLSEARIAAANGSVSVSVFDNALTKSYNLVFVTLYYISSEWKLKNVPVAPIELTAAENDDHGLLIKDEVMRIIGLEASANSVLSNGFKVESETTPLAKRAKLVDPVFNDGKILANLQNNNTIKKGIHFVMHNLFGEYFRSLSRNTEFFTSTDVTRCFTRFLAFLKAKIAHRREKMKLSSDHAQYIESRLLGPIVNYCNNLKGDDLPTINRILPTVREWMLHFERIAENNGDDGELLQTFAKEILLECRNTCEKHFSKDVFFFALILDPSQKNKIRNYLPDKQKRNELTERFKLSVLNFRNVYGVPVETTRAELFDSFFDDDDPIREDDVEKEVISYLCTPSVEFLDENSTSTPPAENSLKCKTEAATYTNILKFWELNETKFPNCAKLARKILAIPATVERDAFVQILSPSQAHKLDAETLISESHAKKIADLGVLISMSS